MIDRGFRSRPRVLRLALHLGALVGLLLTASCDRASGPGFWELGLSGPGPAPGAAFLTLAGEGIEGFEGARGTQVWANQAPGEGGVFRIVVVAPEAEVPLSFRIRVRDVSGPAPSATLVELAGRDNQRIEVTEEFRITLRR
jgi:hypothetical protein